MKINYFFPIFSDEDVGEFLKSFLSTSFFKKHKNNKLILCCSKTDKKNCESLKKICENNKNIKALILDKDFSYNDAFDCAVDYFDGDVVLLGDTKIAKIDFVFEKCLEKKEKGANVVHVVKKRKGFKNFVSSLITSVYNFFVKLFINKRDKLNVLSLGLIDSEIVKLLKVLPKKRCFLKNTKDLIGFDTRTIYIDDETKTYKSNFKIRTSSLLVSETSGIVGGVSLILMILGLILGFRAWFNVLLFGVFFVCLILFSLFLPKHFFEVRNYKTKEISYKIKEIN